MFQQSCQQYKRMQVETAPPERLVAMAMDGALRFLDQAREALDRGEHEPAHGSLLRAQAIITELRCCLDFSAGEMATGLSALYGYMHNRLIEANVSKSGPAVAEVRDLMAELRAAWLEATAAPELCLAGGGSS